MGCFSSKPEPTPYKAPTQQIEQKLQPITEQQPLQQLVKQQPVLSVTRPAVTYGDRERNELKVKNFRDKLETTISTSEVVLQDEARLAVKYYREGKKASARILLRKRQLTQRKIANCQNMLSTVMEMIDSMDLARDNAKFIKSVESGTKAMNDIMKDMSLETVHQALDDARSADEYTKQIGVALQGEHDSMNDAEFESAVAEITEKYGVPQEHREPIQTVAESQAPVAESQTPIAESQVPVAKPQTLPTDPVSTAPATHDPDITNKIATTTPNTTTLNDKISAIPQPPTDLPLPPPTPEFVDEEPTDRIPVAM